MRKTVKPVSSLLDKGNQNIWPRHGSARKTCESSPVSRMSGCDVKWMPCLFGHLELRKFDYHRLEFNNSGLGSERECGESIASRSPFFASLISWRHLSGLEQNMDQLFWVNKKLWKCNTNHALNIWYKSGMCFPTFISFLVSIKREKG